MDQELQVLAQRIRDLEIRDNAKEVRLSVLETKFMALTQNFSDMAARHARAPATWFGAITTVTAILMSLLALYASGVGP